jgi:hypothetical protein
VKCALEKKLSMVAVNEPDCVGVDPEVKGEREFKIEGAMEEAGEDVEEGRRWGRF